MTLQPALWPIWRAASLRPGGSRADRDTLVDKQLLQTRRPGTFSRMISQPPTNSPLT